MEKDLRRLQKKTKAKGGTSYNLVIIVFTCKTTQGIETNFAHIYVCRKTSSKQQHWANQIKGVQDHYAFFTIDFLTSCYLIICQEPSISNRPIYNYCPSIWWFILVLFNNQFHSTINFVVSIEHRTSLYGNISTTQTAGGRTRW